MKQLKKIFIMSILFLASNIVQAQTLIHPKIAGPGELWVNSYNGILFFGRTDMTTQHTQTPFELRFYYNSSYSNLQMGYGHGFSLGGVMTYEIDEVGGVTIKSGDGRRNHFVRYGKEYEASAGIFSTLTQPKNGQYLLVEKTGEKYEFFDSIYPHITAMEDRYGNRVEYHYTDSLLTEISNNLGHSISLVYSNGLLSKATASFINGAYTYSYDDHARLRSITNTEGAVTTYTYDHAGRLCQITDAIGNLTTVVYNNSGMVSRMKTATTDKSIRYEKDRTVFVEYTQPSNEYSYYKWDKQGRVIEKHGLCCGIQSRIEYDEDDNIIALTDANGNTTHYTYDERGNMLTLTDPMGFTERYTYTADFNQVASFQDKNGNTYRFSYNDKGSLTQISGPSNFTQSYTYNDHGWVTTATDANGNVTATQYNNDGTIASIMDAAGYTTTYSYDRYGNLISETDSRGFTTSYTYDSQSRLTQQKDALGNTIALSYDKVGNVVRIKDEKNQITAFTYDEQGNLLTLTNPMGGVYTCNYDGDGNLISEKDPVGNIQTYEWNELNKLVAYTNGESETTRYEYDAKGNLVTVIQPNGNVINYFYDKMDRIQQLTDNIGLIAEYTYDGNGNTLSVTDGLQRTISYHYDALNRLISEVLPSGATTQYQYDNNSNILSLTDAAGGKSLYTYSSLNQLLSHTNALKAKTQYEYDGNGNLVKAIDAKGNATTYTYDALNRNTVISFANGLSMQYTYDAVGNIISSKDRAGQETRYTYNVLGDILTKIYPDGTKDVYTYDAISRMLTAINQHATINFAYDKVGRLLSETLNGKTTAYQYDIAAGKRTLIYPSGMKIDEMLNARDMISSILQNGEEVVSMAYNIAGQKTQQIYANGISTQYGYNANGWIQSIQDNRNVVDWVMSYDVLGNIIKRDNLLNTSLTEVYGYDAISQLTSFTRGTNVSNTYEFDLLGNRVRTSENGEETTYTSNNVNAYTAIRGKHSFTPTYDDNGNLLNDDKHTYQYDYNNRLIGIDNHAHTYKYDALGRRIAKDSIRYYYAGDQMVEEIANGITTSYVYGNEIDEILQITRGNEVYYYHTNHLGSTMAISEINGNLKERVEYDVYGQPSFFDSLENSLAQSCIGNTILFTGREYDYETETYYFRARTQHPMIGRFMQKDPLMYIDGMNDYAYVGNNPLNYIDSWGLERNLFIDLLFGDCLDCFSKDCMSGAVRTAKCLLCAAGFTPARAATTGAKGMSMVGKLGKGVSKLGKNPFNPNMLTNQLKNTKSPRRTPSPKENTPNSPELLSITRKNKPGTPSTEGNLPNLEVDSSNLYPNNPFMPKNSNKIDGNSPKAHQQLQDAFKELNDADPRGHIFNVLS